MSFEQADQPNSIGPGGCVPDQRVPWPPQPFPPKEPDPTPDDLGTAIDWLAFSHGQLYDMVHRGLDVAGATATAAGWAGLGERLDEIGADLRRALERSTQGWQGEAAEAARDSMRELVGWTGDTASKATEVSGCVSRQADNAETARRTMPEPPMKVVHPMPRTSQPAPDDGGTTAMSASPFTGGGFDTAGDLITDRGPERDRRQRLHEQAAEVLGQLQRDSNEVYGTVPEFARPAGRVDIFNDDPELPPMPPQPPQPPQPPPEQPERPEQHEPEPPRGTTDTSAATGAGAAEPGGAPGVSAPLRETLQPGAASAASPVGSGAGPAGPLNAAARTAAGAGPAASAAANTPGAPAGGGGGARAAMGPAGMPIGAMGAGARGGEAGEHTTPDYLEEDSDVFGPDGSVTPPVLGADEPTGNAP